MTRQVTIPTVQYFSLELLTFSHNTFLQVENVVYHGTKSRLYTFYMSVHDIKLQNKLTSFLSHSPKQKYFHLTPAF